MTTADGRDTDPSLQPDEAFAALGNETRMEILRSLGEADEPLSFSALYDRVDVDDSGQFSYHLDKLVGHFVRKTDDGYDLQQAGIRVVEAVLSGAITETPVLEPATIDAPCPYCGSAIEVSYAEERMLARCTECSGEVRGGGSMEPSGALPTGTLELGYLPSAGLKGRTPREIAEASNTWSVAERLAMSNGVCPRCAGPVEHGVQVCEDHAREGICDRCDRRRGVSVMSECLNCPHEKGGMIQRLLLVEPAFRAFYDSRGVDLMSPPPEKSGYFLPVDEEILGTDPLRARFTFTIDDDVLVVTVDDDLTVADITENP